MALPKHTKAEGRKSTNTYCSTVTLVAFVALCLVGVWMMTSSSVIPLQNLDTTQKNDNVNEVIGKSYDSEDRSDENIVNNDVTTKPENSNAKQFEDNPGDLPSDATKGDTNENSQQEKNNPKEESETTNVKEMKQDEKLSNSEDEESKNGDEQGNVEYGKESKNGDNSQPEKLESEGENEKSDATSTDVLPSGAESELLSETSAKNGSFSTQATESNKEKEGHKSVESENNKGYNWKLCNVTAGPDYIPCLDNLQAIKSLRTTKHYEHRERHCPENPPTCLVPLPEGYQCPIEWPTSREKVC